MGRVCLLEFAEEPNELAPERAVAGTPVYGARAYEAAVDGHESLVSESLVRRSEGVVRRGRSNECPDGGQDRSELVRRDGRHEIRGDRRERVAAPVEQEHRTHGVVRPPPPQADREGQHCNHRGHNQDAEVNRREPLGPRTRV